MPWPSMKAIMSSLSEVRSSCVGDMARICLRMHCIPFGLEGASQCPFDRGFSRLRLRVAGAPTPVGITNHFGYRTSAAKAGACRSALAQRSKRCSTLNPRNLGLGWPLQYALQFCEGIDDQVRACGGEDCTVKCSGDGDGHAAGGLRGLHAVYRVLDDPAIGRPERELAEGDEENFGVGLGALKLAAIHRGFEKIADT